MNKLTPKEKKRKKKKKKRNKHKKKNIKNLRHLLQITTRKIHSLITSYNCFIITKRPKIGTASKTKLAQKN